MKSYQYFSVLLLALIVAACSATTVKPGAEKVEIVSEVPNKLKCKFIAEVTGSQGNWLSGNYTSNENLMTGARNVLRNETYKVGGNVVHVQALENSSSWRSLGTTNTIVVGKAYKCS